MNTYLLLKTLHILSSVLLVGTGLGSAFYMFFANRNGSVFAQADGQPPGGAGRLVVHYSLRLLSCMAASAGCPVVWLQIRMASANQAPRSQSQALPTPAIPVALGGPGLPLPLWPWLAPII